MAKPTARTVSEAAAALSERYDAWCATDEEPEERDIDELGALLAKTRGVARKARKLKGGRGRDVEGEVAAQLAEYTALYAGLTGADDDDDDDPFAGLDIDNLDDVDALTRALGFELGEDSQAAILGLRASFLIGRYNRHFAMRPRVTRDVALLEELGRELEKTLVAMTDRLSETLSESTMDKIETIAAQLELWVDEQVTIEEEREALKGEERASARAEVAQAQIDAYRIHVEDMPAALVRPKLVGRLINTVTWVRDELIALTKGDLAGDKRLDEDISELEALITVWQAKRAEVKALRNSMPRERRVRLLEQAAGAVMVRFSADVTSRPEAERDTLLTGEIADQLHELERQLTRAYRKHKKDTVRIDFLNHVRGQLRAAELLYESLREREDVV